MNVISSEPEAALSIVQQLDALILLFFQIVDQVNHLAPSEGRALLGVSADVDAIRVSVGAWVMYISQSSKLLEVVEVVGIISWAVALALALACMT